MSSLHSDDVGPSVKLFTCEEKKKKRRARFLSSHVEEEEEEEREWKIFLLSPPRDHQPV